MTQSVGFDNQKYLDRQSKAILERAKAFDNKLYLEFGGKLIFDYHASRILPGFDPTAKIQLLQRLRDKAEIILCLCAADIERKKLRADFGITYDADALRLVDDLRSRKLDVRAIAVTRYADQPAASQFVNQLKRRNMTVYVHRATKGYPTDVDTIVSSEGYGANPYIETAKPIVVVTAPGPGSGKMGTCLSQMYHDHCRGLTSGFAKFETFPIWNLPLKHPVNLAYEAATADLGDYNEVDPFHLAATGDAAINYNRDIEVFPVLKRILERITHSNSSYRSPTEMGVNCAGFAITDDDAVKEASVQEIIRRYFRYRCEYAMGVADRKTVERVELILKELGLEPESRRVVGPARAAAREAEAEEDKGHKGIFCGAAIELKDGAIILGKNSPLMHVASSLVINAVKHLAGIPTRMHLLPASVIESVGRLKKGILRAQQISMDLEETLIALSISATTNPAAEMALETLEALRGCEAHMTHIPTPGDEAGLRRLGINLTSDPDFSSKNLFIT